MVKLRHKINHGWAPDRTDPAWADRVEREAAVHTDQLERRIAKAEQRVTQAEQRAASAGRRTRDRRRLDRLWAEVEERRQELLRLQALAQQSPGGPQRHRPVPEMRPL